MALGIANLRAMSFAATSPGETFPQPLQWTWAENIASCEAELTNGIVIRAQEIGYYDGPERLIKVGAAIRWSSAKGKAVTYVMTLVTDTPAGVGRDVDRNKSYKQKFTLVGNDLYLTDADVAASTQLTARNRFVRCPNKSYR